MAFVFITCLANEYRSRVRLRVYSDLTRQRQINGVINYETCTKIELAQRQICLFYMYIYARSNAVTDKGT